MKKLYFLDPVPDSAYLNKIDMATFCDMTNGSCDVANAAGNATEGLCDVDERPCSDAVNIPILKQ